MSRPSAFGENLPSMHLKALLGIATKQTGNNNEDIAGHSGPTSSSAGIQQSVSSERRRRGRGRGPVWEEGIPLLGPGPENLPPFNPFLAPEPSDLPPNPFEEPPIPPPSSPIPPSSPKGTQTPNNQTNLASIISQGIRDALQIKDPVMGYKEPKETRDLNRLSGLFRTPESKTWTKQELEHFNRTGSVKYYKKDIENKKLPNIFDPNMPKSVYTNQSANAMIALKPNFTAYENSII